MHQTLSLQQNREQKIMHKTKWIILRFTETLYGNMYAIYKLLNSESINQPEPTCRCTTLTAINQSIC